MKKFLLILFILADLGVIGASAVVLVSRVRNYTPASRTSTPAAPTAPMLNLGGSTPAAGGTTTQAPAAPGESSNVRKILFSYRNPKAQKVSIRADFTGWKAEVMQKTSNGVWTYLAHLTPGEYAYCFTVGDKIINDPANKRTKVIGRTTVSSIVVESLASKAAK